MVGVFSSMLNVFLPFTNTFLLCLFFLAWLIPQLLQKSRSFKDIAGSNINTGSEVLPLFYFTGTWSNGTTYEDSNTGALGIANNGSNASKSSFYGYWEKGDQIKKNHGANLNGDIFTSSTDWTKIESITIDYTYDSTLTNNTTSKNLTTHATRATTTVTITYNDGTDADTYEGVTNSHMWTETNANGTAITENVYQFHATGITVVDDTYVSSYKVTGLQTAVIPEPATATLSLLALAGLAMRRRRK